MEPYNSDTNWYEINETYFTFIRDARLEFSSEKEIDTWKDNVIEYHNLTFIAKVNLENRDTCPEYWYNESENVLYYIRISKYCDFATVRPNSEIDIEVRKKYNLPLATCKMEKA
jgi:hypothetical protein